MQARLTSRSSAEQRMAAARRARADTLTRAGVQAAAAEGLRKVAAATVARTEDDLAARARAAGYPDLDSLLAQTSGLTAAQLAGLLDVPVKRIWGLRRRRGQPGPGRWRNRPTPLTPEQLAGLPAGAQPVHGDLHACRCCGRWYQALAVHLAESHWMTRTAYRQRYGLTPPTRWSPGDP
ncbi:MAG: hypothetical protein L0Y54_18025, partial [Sporichthyaceae bacterium]|nr:hypothetical protein [Sporichthyaceae bacterium]